MTKILLAILLCNFIVFNLKKISEIINIYDKSISI